MGLDLDIVARDDLPREKHAGLALDFLDGYLVAGDVGDAMVVHDQSLDHQIHNAGIVRQCLAKVKESEVPLSMDVLVTGGAGFIGSWTVDLLLEKGYEVRILDNLQPRVHPRGKPPWLAKEAEFIQGDVANREELARALDGMDYVIHLAAYQDYMPDFSQFIHTNTESSALLFELIVADPKRYPVRKVVFASSQAVCGEGRYACGKIPNAQLPIRRQPPVEGDGHSIVIPGPRVAGAAEAGGLADTLPGLRRDDAAAAD
jgi:hypothetical protein